MRPHTAGSSHTCLFWQGSVIGGTMKELKQRLHHTVSLQVHCTQKAIGHTSYGSSVLKPRTCQKGAAVAAILHAVCLQRSISCQARERS